MPTVKKPGKRGANLSLPRNPGVRTLKQYDALLIGLSFKTHHSLRQHPRAHGRSGVLSAPDAFQSGPDEVRSALFVPDPGPILPRRIVTNVLAVSTVEVRHPIALCILMEAGNPARHTWPIREAHVLSQ